MKLTVYISRMKRKHKIVEWGKHSNSIWLSVGELYIFAAIENC